MNHPNPKQAYGDKKVKLQLVPPAAMIAIANGLEEGAAKYSPWNWRDDPVELMTYLGAVERHLAAWKEGEDVDPDSNGKTHLEGAIASLAILIDATTLGEGEFIDNRPKKCSPGALESLQRGSRKSEPAPGAVTLVLDWEDSMLNNQFVFEPNWDMAPDWAQWCAVDKGGRAQWFRMQPSTGREHWLCTGEGLVALGVDYDFAHIEFTGGCPYWRESLSKRPEGK